MTKQELRAYKAQWAREWRAKNPVEARQKTNYYNGLRRKRLGKALNKRVTESVRRWRQKYPEKRKAQMLVFSALRNGTLVKTPCDVCGAIFVHAHHYDYSKPLVVRWVCPRHHALIHNPLPLARS